MSRGTGTFLALGLLALCCVSSSLAGQPATAGEQHSRLARLFDYESYKQTFGKSYAGELENSVRKCYFYARALDAFVSGVNYKYRHADYFKALNEMSDWTPEERARAINKRPGADSAPERPLAFMPAADEHPEETLRKFLVQHVGTDPAYRDLLDQIKRPSPRRPKREVGGPEQGARDFSFDRLINAGGETKETAAKRPPVVRSNNPNYRGLELETRGVSDQLEEIELVYLQTSADGMGSLEDQLERSLSWLGGPAKSGLRRGRSRTKPAGREAPTEAGDEVFFDHRNSNCLSEVRKQGKCGCCYAFASIAIAEWIHCKQTGSLVAFSEQYMVDCGKHWIDGMQGCNQGTDMSTVEFIHNFGLELRANYPYLGHEGTCPYHEGTDLSTTGYIRMDLGGFVEIPMSVWHKVIAKTPMYIIVDVDDPFLDYGGGVYDGARCRQLTAGAEPDLTPLGEYHAMVLVGHGREDGQEYWLIRNSHGANWGEGGYYKLSKEAKGCVPRQVAYAFGTGRPQAKKNRRHDATVVAARNKKRGAPSKGKSKRNK